MDVSIAEVAADDEAVAALMPGYADEMAERYGNDDLGPVLEPGARWLVGRRDGQPVCCVAVQELEPGVGELKRMYVAPVERGRGMGRALLAAAEGMAADAGWATLRLETGDAQPEAVRLYEASGWRRIPAYGYWRDSPRSICFEKRVA